MIELSICIPTYNQTKYLSRTLDSILCQDFISYEIIISDDSSTDDVFYLVENYKQKFPISISYSRNSPSLGSPMNWDFVISKARGKWIKIMHHDEWFYSNDALKKMVENLNDNKNCFVFAGIKGTYSSNKKEYLNLPSCEIVTEYNNDPFKLIKGNFIGPPSCILFPNVKIQFDSKLKWLVDVDFYIRLMVDKKLKIIYIKEVLLENCMDDHNISNQYIGNLEYQMEEYIYILRKYSKMMSLNNKIHYFIFVYKFLNSFNQQNSIILLLRLLKKRFYV